MAVCHIVFPWRIRQLSCCLKVSLETPYATNIHSYCRWRQVIINMSIISRAKAKDSHFKDKTVSWPFYITTGILISGNTVFTLKRSLVGVQYICWHYSDVTRASCRLKSPSTRLCFQTVFFMLTTKNQSPHYFVFVRIILRLIPRTKVQ